MTPHIDNITISIVIPVYNGGDKFRQCLDAIAGLDPGPAETIVVADGGDEDLSHARTLDRTTLIRLPEQRGPAHARNVGAAQARGNVLFFVDADVTVRPDAVGQISRLFSSEPGLGAVFGSYDDSPAEPDFLSQYRNLLHHFVHQSGLEEASTFWAACGAVRTEFFRSVGGFDSNMYPEPSIEDVELGYRLRKAGHRIRLCKTLQVKHLKKWNAVSIVRTDILQRAIPWTELIIRERGFLNDLNTGVSGRISVAVACALLPAIALSIWYPISLALAALAALSLLYLNRSLYGFFLRKRGLWFAVKAIPCHWLYFIYSGTAFVLGTFRHYLRRSQTSAALETSTEL